MVIYLFIYLFIYYTRSYSRHCGVGAHNAKERDKKERQVRRVKKKEGIEAQRVKHPTQARVTDALIEDEEQNEEQKRTKRKKQGTGPQPATLDHSVVSYDTQGSYGKPRLTGGI